MQPYQQLSMMTDVYVKWSHISNSLLLHVIIIQISEMTRSKVKKQTNENSNSSTYTTERTSKGVGTDLQPDT